MLFKMIFIRTVSYFN